MAGRIERGAGDPLLGPRPEVLIARIRRAHLDMRSIFLRGACYDLFLILKEVFPDAVACYDCVNGHVHTMIGGVFYDITGITDPNRDYLVRLPHPDYRPWEWRPQKKGV